MKSSKCFNAMKFVLMQKRAPCQIQYRTASTFSKFRKWYQEFWSPELNNSNPKPPHNHVCQVGDPVLRIKADEVELQSIKNKEIKQVISCMKDVMKHYKVVGIAAPQIGVPLRIIAVEFSNKIMDGFSEEIRKNREMEVCKQRFIINPSIQTIDATPVTFDEGCVSINGFSAYVTRHREILVSGYNEEAEPINWQVKGWLARILQHECDHLDGHLITDKMDPKSFQFDYWYVVNTTGGRYVHRFK
ncbi:hypothetical protein CHUAL_001616 [Chamberlinius hualienensis]